MHGYISVPVDREDGKLDICECCVAFEQSAVEHNRRYQQRKSLTVCHLDLDVILVENIVQFAQSSDHCFNLFHGQLHVAVSSLVRALYGRYAPFCVCPERQTLILEK